MVRLQSKEEKEMYDFDNENKESIEKKIEFLFRHIKKGLKNLLKQEFTPVSSSFHTKSNLKNLKDPKFAFISSTFNTKSDQNRSSPKFAFAFSAFNTNLD